MVAQGARLALLAMALGAPARSIIFILASVRIPVGASRKQIGM